MAAAERVTRDGQRAVRLTVGRMVVEFTWQVDRWTHAVGPAASGSWRSLEGPATPGGDPCWPASPVLTEVSLLAGDPPAVVGVGRAGRTHFSLCVSPHPAVADGLLFEAACRIHGPPGWLGSSYRGPDGGLRRVMPAVPLSAPPVTICWRYVVTPAGVEPEPPSTGDCSAAG